MYIARLLLFGALSGDTLYNLLLYFHASQEENERSVDFVKGVWLPMKAMAIKDKPESKDEGCVIVTKSKHFTKC